MKKNIVFLASIGLMMLFACSEHKLIPNTISDEKNTLTILYDDVCRIKEMSVSPMMKYSFFYNDLGNIIKITSNDSNQAEEYYFSYNRNTVTVKHLIPSSGYEGNFFYTINDKGYAIGRVYRNNHGLHTESEFEYDQVGNLLKISNKAYSFLGESNVISYEYDNANGICMNINAPKWFYLFLDRCLFNNSTIFLSIQNNVSKMTITENYPVSYTNTYTYYENNYPETMEGKKSGNLSIHYIKRK